MTHRSRPLLVAISLALIACQGATEGVKEPDPIRFVPGQGSAEELSDVERDIARRAVEALAENLGIPASEILVDTVRAVQWPDSSIGCPEPGRAYLQVVTPGHKVTLRAKGRIHVVHEGKNRVFVCRKTKAYGAVTPELELAFGKPMTAARDDLARRLGVAPGDIKPVSGLQQSWPDASLGCPEQGVDYPRGKVDGWVLTLRHGTRDYTYHTDMTRTIPCPAITTE